MFCFLRLFCLLPLAWLLACTTERRAAETAAEQRLAAPVPRVPFPVVTHTVLVVSAHPLASQVGSQVLRDGGNAYDAAVAVQFALAVVLPAAGNIGGGGFLVYLTPEGKSETLDFRETAPAAARRDMYLDAAGTVVPDLSTAGALAVGTPGTVAGMAALHKKLGRLTWAAVVQPAVRLAATGFQLTAKEAEGLNRNRAAFLAQNPAKPPPYVASAAQPWQAGQVLKLPALAATLLRIRDQGAAGFYGGETARLLLAEMARRGGLITAADLKNYQPKWRPTLRGKYRGYDVLTMPPPSSGGVALLQMLGMVEAANFARLGYHTPAATHLLTEVERRAYADRATYLGDPDFGQVPVARLLAAGYLNQRAATIRPDGHATPSSAVAAGRGLPRYESTETTHYNIVDGAGNAVSCTTTLNGGYGSHVVVPGAGFLLNNEMDDFSAKPGVPNAYGLVGGAANAIAPGKRMLSSMTPTILARKGKPYLVLGSPGGSTIITTVLQAIVGVVDYGFNAQQAAAAPRLHHQWLPDQLDMEDGALLPAAQDVLSQHGYVLNPRAAWGRLDLIRVLPEGGGLEGGADPRGDDAAQGY